MSVGEVAVREPMCCWSNSEGFEKSHAQAVSELTIFSAVGERFNQAAIAHLLGVGYQL